MTRLLPFLLALLVADLALALAMADTNAPVVGVTNTLTTATVISDIEKTVKTADRLTVSGQNREESILAGLQRMYLKHYEIDVKATNLIVSVNCGDASYQVSALIGGEGRITNFVVKTTPIYITAPP